MNNRILLISLLALILFFSPVSFAETILLKSGKAIEGNLVEKTDKYIKMDIEGVPLTYFLDDIESIDGKKINSSSRDNISDITENLAIEKTDTQERWYTLGGNEEYVSDFLLQPHSVKEIDIKSNVKENIMFRVDIKGMDAKVLTNGPFSITMTDLTNNKSVSSFYAGLDLEPVNGERRLEFKNSGDAPYKILVIKNKGLNVKIPLGSGMIVKKDGRTFQKIADELLKKQ